MAGRKIWLVLALLAASVQLLQAAAPDRRAFDNAFKLLTDGFYARAEEEFGKFSKDFAGSPLVAEAVLCQAQARYQQTNTAGAIQLLQQGLTLTNAPVDQYLFWLGEAYFQQADYKKASDSFATLLKNHPASPRALKASIEEANARARLREWPRVIELLQQTNGVFQTMSRTNSAAPEILQGYLLLGEAHLAQANYQAADLALQPMGKLLLKPEIAWNRQYLICRVRAAEGKLEDALAASTNLLALAATTARRDLAAESAAFHGGVLERLGRPDPAIAAYQANLAEGIPAERQRQALLKITELYLAQNRVAEAAQMLERFSAQYPAAESADLALLTLGELRLRQHVTAPQTGRPEAVGTNGAALNYLEQAFGSLNLLINRFTNSSLLGKAQLDLGWCYWFTNKMPEAARAFQLALERLPPSLDKARAQFKLGDARFLQKDFAAALTNYSAVLDQAAALPEPARREVETNLFETALYQVVRAALAGGTPTAATNALQKLLAWYPKGFHTERAVLIAGQDISQRGNPAEARQMFSQFITNAPGSALVPELSLAIAWTYEQEGNWKEAIEQYERWFTQFGNDPARPRAEYYRALAYSMAGRETNALTCFTNFVAKFPTNELTPLAKWWIGDYYSRAGQLLEAESTYQLVWPKNLPPSPLGYNAQLTAGKIAVTRQAWLQASNYFTALYNDTNCPTNIRVEALFAYGDILSLVDSPETNKLGNFEEAIRVFGRICEEYPNHPCAALAWGRKAGCLLQWAQYSHQYDAASNAFQRVIDAPLADARARSNARLGLAVILEKEAQQKTGAEQSQLLQLALKQCLDVIYELDLRTGEKADPFWQKEAGLMAGRLLEGMQDWSQAANVYRRLQELLPPLRERLEEKILKAQENLNRPREKPTAKSG